MSDRALLFCSVFYLVEQTKGFATLPSSVPLPSPLLFTSCNGFPVSSSLQCSLSVSALLTVKLFIIYYVLNADNVTCKGCRLKERHLCRCDLCFLQAVSVENSELSYLQISGWWVLQAIQLIQSCLSNICRL